HGAGHFRFDKARGNGRGTDTVTGQLFGPAHRHRGHTCLGSRVVGLAYVTGARHAGNVDNAAFAAGFDHLGGRFPATEEHAGQVHVDHRLPLLQAHALFNHAVFAFYQQGVAQDAGVVHQAVDATEILHALVEGGDHLIFFSNVADIGAGVATGLLAQLHGFVELLLAQVDQSQLGTL